MYELTPLSKMQILQLSNINVFSVQKSSFSIKNNTKHYFSSVWPRKMKVKKLQSFDQNHGVTPFQKMKIFQLLIVSLFVG